MPIETEPIGSIPRTPALLEAMKQLALGRLTPKEFEAAGEAAVKETIQRLETTGSPVLTDGEQTKPSFVTYPLHGLESLAPKGVVIPFADGHTRELPSLTRGPFRFKTHADSYLTLAQKFTRKPVKQAVISASALSLIYPQAGIPGYDQAAFLDDVVSESVADIRQCLAKGAHVVQMDFTEARLSLKLDGSKGLLKTFVALNNRVLDQFTPEERKRIGVHTCPGGDRDSTHSADIDYAALLPDLLQMHAGRFYLQMASENDRKRVLEVVREHSKPDQKIFIGVTDPINPRVETPEEVADRVMEAARYIPPPRLGTTDDCGFSPFGDDVSTSRDVAFEKIRSRVLGTALAAKKLGIE